MAKYRKGVKLGSTTYTYGGTLMSGAKKTATTRPKAGLPKVGKGATYVNTETGCVYECDAGGDSAHAKWKYKTTVICGRPRVGVTGLKLVREAKGSRKLTASWKVPDALTTTKDGKGGHRATGLRRRWKFDTSDKGKVNIIDKEDTSKESATSASEDLAGFKVGNVTYGRNSFYPYAGKPKLNSVTFLVNPYNGFGNGKKTANGKHDVAQSKTITFKPPRVPTIGALSFDAETGKVSGTIDTNAGEDAQERLWTVWEVKVTDTSRPKARQTWVHASKNNDTRTSIPFAYNASNYQSLVGDQYIRVYARAMAQGFAGDSAWSAWTSYYVAIPRAATVEPRGTKVRVTSKGSDGRVIVPISVNATTEHPTDRVRLQCLRNVSYARADQIPGTAEWDDLGAVDDGACTALVADVLDLKPNDGLRTWVRVKSWHGSEESLHAYSAPRELRELFVAAPTVADDECHLHSVKALRGGTSVRAVIAYDAKDGSSRDDATGTSLEWSDDSEAWRSTEEPQAHEFDWHDDVTASEVSADYYRSQSIKVKGLEEGVTYWFRARRYMDDADGNRTYGAYSETLRCTTASVPSEGGDSDQEVPAVALTAPATIARGSGLRLSWTTAANAQDAWTVLGPSDVVLASGQDASGGCTLPWEQVAKAEADGALTLRVRVTENGEHADSAPRTVRIADRPTCLPHASTLTVQPLAFVVETTSQSASVTYTVRAEGCCGSSPSGGYVQADGDVLDGGVAAPAMTEVAWESTLERAGLVEMLADAEVEAARLLAELNEIPEGADGREEAQAEYDAAAATVAKLSARVATGGTRYQGAVTVAPGLEFHDGCGYYVEATVTDPSTGLASEVESAAFEVAWAHQAVPPSDEIEVTPLEGEDEAGVPLRSVSIALAAPDGALGTDVYDIYRVTHDGATLVSPSQGLPLDYEVTDEYAPYGDAGDYCYRVALRTADGDVEWSDYHYVSDPGVLRFDFADKAVELPYDIRVGDGYTKDVERRAHMDGGTEAYWNASVNRKATLSTTLLRVEDAGDAAMVRALAQHAGPVFVRTPDGSAYEADVQVGSLDAEGELLLATFDAHQVDETQAFMLPLPQTVEDEPEEEP